MTERYLDGKAVVITGSGRGIGAACARHAAEHGASVVVNDLNLAEAEVVVKEIRDNGGTAIAVAADITSWSEAEGLVDACVAEYGRIDGLVNNAGLFRLHTLDEVNETEMREVIQTNVFGVAFCGTFAARRMRDQGSGSIVNVTSGAHCGIARQAAYSASKGAVASITFTWALELAGTGVRVNALSPRGRTRMMQYGLDYRARSGGKSVHRTEMPDASANAPLVTYLLSDRSAAVHGQIVRMDGPVLGLYSHPAVLLPVHRRDDWTVEDIDKAFADDLVDRQVPLGIVGIDVDHFTSDEAEWETVPER